MSRSLSRLSPIPSGISSHGTNARMIAITANVPDG
jgi:hypothetical protein